MVATNAGDLDTHEEDFRAAEVSASAGADVMPSRSTLSFGFDEIIQHRG